MLQYRLVRMKRYGNADASSARLIFSDDSIIESGVLVRIECEFFG